jgi:PKD repeat protein
VWIIPPTVGQATGNQAPTADPGGPYTTSAGIQITFDGSGSDDPDGRITEYLWDLGNGETRNGRTVNWTYTNPNTYHVTLTVTDDVGAKSSASTTATVGAEDQPPVADGGGDPSGEYTGTAGVPVQFDGSGSTDDVGIASYRWNWGDGSNTSEDGTTVDPTHTYEFGGFYTVTFTITDTVGQEDKDYVTVDIADSGNQPPVADAGPSVDGVVGEEVSFDASGSEDPDGEITRYDWNFGDGTGFRTDLGPTPSYTYSRPDTYTVTVIVPDPDDPEVSDSDTTTANIVSGNQKPVADAGGPYSTVFGEPVQMDASGSSDPDGDEIVQYAWDFGDGSTGSGQIVEHTYTTERPGSALVTLTIIDERGGIGQDETNVYVSLDDGSDNQPPVADAGGPYPGLVGQAVDFDASASSDDGGIVRYDWDFGDGNGAMDAGPTPSHTYKSTGPFEARVTVTDDQDAQDVDKTDVTISDGNSPPTADPGGPYRGQAGVPITLDGSGSNDPDEGGSISSYSWKLGDPAGGTREGKTPTYTYAEAGIYHVTLTVTDNEELPASGGTLAVIGDGSTPPTADAGGPYIGSTGDPVSFDGSGSSDPDGDIATYVWDFGDGSPTKNGRKPTHTYAAAANYNVQLTVTDDSGESDTDNAAVIIGTGNLPPTSDAGGPYRGAVGAPVRFDGSASSDPNDKIASYSWDFGDGGTAKGKMPTHTYEEADTYLATLTVTDQFGVANSDDAPVVVTDDTDPIRQVLALSDANGNGSPDLALIRRDADRVYRAHVFDGGSGETIRSIGLGVSPIQAVAVVERPDGSDDIAAMRQIPNGSTRVLVVNSGSGETVANLNYGTGFVNLDVAAADIDGDGSPEVGVLSESISDRSTRVFFRNVDTEANVTKFFLNARFRPLQLLALPTVNGGSDAEAGVSLIDRSSKKAGVRVVDTGTKEVLQKLEYGATYRTVTTAVIPGAGKAGRAGVVQLGVASDPDGIRVRMRDGGTAALLMTSFINNTRSAVDVAAVADLNGDGKSDIATLIGSDENKGKVLLYDAATGAKLRHVDMKNIEMPADLAVSADIDGNGADELVGLGVSDGVDRIAIFDSATGTKLRKIDVP